MVDGPEKLVKLSDIMADPGNQLFGLPLSTLQRLIYEAQERGDDPYRSIPGPDGNSDDLTGTDWERKEKK